MTEDEIKAIINEGTEQGTIEEAEQEIIERVFHLGDRNITSLMTHRSDIIWFDLNETEDMIKEKIISASLILFIRYAMPTSIIIKGMVSIKEMYVAHDSTPFKDLMTPGSFCS